jgi:membrane-bound serine protease (ClpP class)
MSWWLVFAVFLYFLSAALLVAEVFVPSGGLISLCALACLAGGLAIFFRFSTTAGWVGVAVAAVMIPSLLVMAYRMFPKTRFGRSATLTPPSRRAGDAIPDAERLRGLLGKSGRVLTPLRPVGTCDFSGWRVECVAESGYVDRGKEVTVIRVMGTQLTVREVEKGQT